MTTLSSGSAEDLVRAKAVLLDPGPGKRRLGPEALRTALSASPIRRVLSGPGAALNAVALSSTEALVAASGLDGSVRVWNTDSASVVANFRAHQGPALPLASSPDGQTLLTSSADDPLVRLWDPRAGTPTAQLASDGRGVASAAFSGTGRFVAAGTADGKVGVATRAAIKKMQQKFGLPADSYPSPELLARLRAGR